MMRERESERNNNTAAHEKQSEDYEMENAGKNEKAELKRAKFKCKEGFRTNIS